MSRRVQTALITAMAICLSLSVPAAVRASDSSDTEAASETAEVKTTAETTETKTTTETAETKTTADTEAASETIVYISAPATLSFGDETGGVYRFSGGLARITQNGKYGYADRKGRIIIQPEYDYAWDFTEGLAVVGLKGSRGVIDKSGDEIIPIEYGMALPYSEGLALVGRGGKYGFADRTGAVVIPLKFDYAYSFSDGLAVVRLNGKYGYINKRGIQVIPANLKYDAAYSFHGGMAMVELAGKYGFINKAGDEIIPPGYDLAAPFSDGLARVAKGGKYGFIDVTGKTVIPLKYDYAIDFSEGLARVCVGSYPNDKYGFVDAAGNIAVPLIYDYADSFSDGYALVEQDGKYSFIDKGGTAAINIDFDYARSFSDGLAAVNKDGKEGFIDKSGRVVVPLIYDYAYDFSDGLAWVMTGRARGVLQIVSGEVTGYIYDEADYAVPDMLIVGESESYTDKDAAVIAIENAVSELVKLYIDSFVAPRNDVESNAADDNVTRGDEINREKTSAEENSDEEDEYEAGTTAGIKAAAPDIPPIQIEFLTRYLEAVIERFASAVITSDNFGSGGDAQEDELQAAVEELRAMAEDVLSANGIMLLREIRTGFVTAPRDGSDSDSSSAGDRESDSADYSSGAGDHGESNESGKAGRSVGGDGKAGSAGETIREYKDISGKPKEMRDAINALSSEGVINGITEDTFSPDRMITRAEAATMIMRILSRLDPEKYRPVDNVGVFEDVSPDDWFFGAVYGAKQYGVMNGIDETTFSPLSVIRKDQFIAIAARALRSEMGYHDPDNISDILSRYTDTGEIPEWAGADTALAARAGLILQRHDNRFDSGSPVSRGDAAIILYRLFILL